MTLEITTNLEPSKTYKFSQANINLIITAASECLDVSKTINRVTIKVS